MPLKITEMFAFVTTDRDGDEGVVAWRSPSGEWHPLVGADLKRVESLMKLAQRIAREENRTIRILKFSHSEQIGEVNP